MDVFRPEVEDKQRDSHHPDRPENQLCALKDPTGKVLGAADPMAGGVLEPHPVGVLSRDCSGDLHGSISTGLGRPAILVCDVPEDFGRRPVPMSDPFLEDDDQDWLGSAPTAEPTVVGNKRSLRLPPAPATVDHRPLTRRHKEEVGPMSTMQPASPNELQETEGRASGVAQLVVPALPVSPRSSSGRQLHLSDDTRLLSGGTPAGHGLAGSDSSRGPWTISGGSPPPAGVPNSSSTEQNLQNVEPQQMSEVPLTLPTPEPVDSHEAPSAFTFLRRTRVRRKVTEKTPHKAGAPSGQPPDGVEPRGDKVIDCREQGQDLTERVDEGSCWRASQSGEAPPCAHHVGAAAQQREPVDLTVPPQGPADTSDHTGRGPPHGDPSATASAISGRGTTSSTMVPKAAARQPGASAPRVDAVLVPPVQYDPVAHACYQPGAAAPYLHIARTLAALDSTTKRLKISDALTNMFRTLLALSPGDMVQAVYLVCGKIAPEYEGLELNVGGSTISGALVEATGVSRSRLREMYKNYGDPGDLAQACKRNQSTLRQVPPLTVARVFQVLRQIAVDKGQGSAGRRQQAVLGLLRACRECETKYLVRTLAQNLRVGASWRSVLGPLARAVLMDREGVHVSKGKQDEAAAAVTYAYHMCPNFDILVRTLVEEGLEALREKCIITPGVPVKPMLAKICEGVADGLRQLGQGPFLAEYKYDGQRAQIHLGDDGQVKIFSRNCEDRTQSFPDVVMLIREAAKGGCRSCVVDAELVAVEVNDEGDVRLRAFQDLATRARGEVQVGEIRVHVCVFVFDILFVDGTSLLQLPLRARRERLISALCNMSKGRVEMATSKEICPSEGAAVKDIGALEQVDLEAATDITEKGEGPPAERAGAIQVGPATSTLVERAVPGDIGHEENHDADRVDLVAIEDVDHEAQSTAGPPASIPSPSTATPPAPAPSPPTSALSVPAPSPSTSPPSAPAPSLPTSAPSPPLLTLSTEGQVWDYLLEAFAAGTEGLMLKRLDTSAAYEPSRRSESWIKVKRDYCEGLRDSLDLVVIGAWYGQGRKVHWFSPFLLAVWDPEREEYQSLCRCISGFTDAFYTETTARLKQTIIPGPKPYYNTPEQPDVWFEPKEVWEIRGADLTLSPVHKAAVGLLHSSRGVGLRFPRFIRRREDKAPEQASDPQLVCDM